MANEKPRTIVNVNIYNPDSGKSKATNHVVLEADVKGWDLKKLRQELRSGGALRGARLTAEFCTLAGGVIADSMLFENYQAMLSKPKDEEKKETDEKKGKVEKKEKVTSYDVYLREKEKKEGTGLSEEVKEFLNKELNLDLKGNEPKFLDAKVKTLSSSYDHSNYKATAGSANITNPAKMSEEDWLVMLRHEALIALHHKFGHFFPTRIELGGRLHSSEEMSTFGTATEDEAASAMKASASASLSGKFVQASASYSKEEQEKSASSSKISQLQRSITWQAQGGDTLLSWCSTVSGFESWRVIKQEDVLPMGEFISTFKGYEGTSKTFAEIAERTRKTKKVYFRLKVENKRREGKYLSVTMSSGQISQSIKAELTYMNDTDANQRFESVKNTKQYKIIQHRTIEFEASAIVGELTNDTVFEVDIETYLDQPAELRYGTVHQIVHQRTRRFLSAIDGIPDVNSTMYLFPGEGYDATLFMITKGGGSESTDTIRENDVVELRVLDKDENFKGFAAFGKNETVCSRPWTTAWMYDDVFQV